MNNSTNPQEEQKPVEPQQPEIKVRTMADDLESFSRVPPPPSDEPLFTPETVNQLEGGVVESERGGKKLFGMLGGVAAVLVLAAVGYFVIYPRITQKEAGPIVQTPGSEASTPAGTQPLVHATFLTRSPAAIADVTAASLTVSGIRSALLTEAERPLAEGSFKEVNVLSAGARIEAPAYFGALLSPAPNAASLAGAIERDFTALLYYDRNGTWPVYIVKGTLVGFETSDVIENFYLSDPGAFQPWKEGAVGGYATRYAVGSVPGASFNYGAFGNYVILSTSFNALKAALPLLGL